MEFNYDKLLFSVSAYELMAIVGIAQIKINFSLLIIFFLSVAVNSFGLSPSERERSIRQNIPSRDYSIMSRPMDMVEVDLSVHLLMVSDLVRKLFINVHSNMHLMKSRRRTFPLPVVQKMTKL